MKSLAPLARVAVVLFAGLALLGTAKPGQAQELQSSKPIRLIVGLSPGGGTDVTARLVAQKMSANMGMTVLVENKAGGNFIPARTTVAGNALGAVPPESSGTRTTWPHWGHLTFLPASAALTLRLFPQPEQDGHRHPVRAEERQHADQMDEYPPLIHGRQCYRTDPFPRPWPCPRATPVISCTPASASGTTRNQVKPDGSSTRARPKKNAAKPNHSPTREVACAA